MAKDGADFSRHSAVMSYFQKNYVKTGIFDVKFSDYIGDAFNMRNDGDYSYFFVGDKEDAETQYNHAVEFYETVKNFLKGGDS